MASNFNANQVITEMQAVNQSSDASLLSLFDILDAQLASKPSSIDQQSIFNQALIDHCMAQAIKARASHPNVLAEHILLIAQNAFNQQIQQPSSQSLVHAKKAASALIMAQTNAGHARFGINHFNRYAFMACMGLIGISLFYYWSTLQQTLKPKTPTTISTITAPIVTSPRMNNDSLSAQEASEMYAKYELMRSGTCRYLEALQLPDKDKAIYIDSVVGGKLPTNLGDLAIANKYLEKVSCNYTPMLMKKSK